MLQKCRNTNDKNTEIQITKIQKYKSQKLEIQIKEILFTEVQKYILQDYRNTSENFNNSKSPIIHSKP